MIIPEDVQRDSTTLETQKLPAQMQFLLNETKEKIQKAMRHAGILD